MYYLSVNPGSSSLKICLYDETNKKEIATAKWEKEFSRVSVKTQNTILKDINVSKDLEAPTALIWLIKYLYSIGIIESFEYIEKIAYRFVHGGTEFVKPTKVNESVLEKLKDIDNLSIVHNPVSRRTVEEGVKCFPNSEHVLCFDTDFHSTIPEVARMYGIPLYYYERGVRKFGAHGLSHRYVGERAAEILNKPFSEFSGIICHLGNGSSITAIENGKSIDTTMGLTPVDGLVMGHRCGSVDPTVVQRVMEIDNIDIDEAIELLSKKSGFLGISRISSDYRVLKDWVKEKKTGYERAKKALDLFKYQIIKYIGSYMAILSHVDAVIFTGGIGENDKDLMNSCINEPGMKNFGLEVVENPKQIPNKKIPVFQISTNEEFEMIRILEEGKY